MRNQLKHKSIFIYTLRHYEYINVYSTFFVSGLIMIVLDIHSSLFAPPPSLSHSLACMGVFELSCGCMGDALDGTLGDFV